jgi:hypothetical protein
MGLINEFFNIFIIVRLLKTIKKVIEEAEDRYLSACENNVPLKELDKLEENYKFNEVIIFIDVSDIQDEATLWELDDNDLLVLKDVSRKYDPKLKTDNLKKKIKENLPLTHNILVKIKLK